MADGVSRCELSKEGARFVCRKTARAVIEEADYLFGLPYEKAAGLIVKYIQAQIEKMAEEKRTEAWKYSSTLSFICHHKRLKKIMTFNLGDSCIYTIDSKNTVKQLDISRTDCYTTVSTMTQGAERETVVGIYDESEFDSVFLCTDGFWKIMEGSRKNNAELKKAIINRDMKYVTEFIENTHNPDDCTFLYFKLVQ